MPRRTRSAPAPGGSGAKAARTDLTAQASAPVQAPAAPTGMGYGQHAESIQAQEAMPLPQGTSTPGPAAPAGAPGGGGGNFADVLAQAMSHQSPDSMGGLTGPSLNPNEPVQAGLASGPGPGPSAMQPDTPRASTYLRQLAISSQNPELAELAALAQRMSA